MCYISTCWMFTDPADGVLVRKRPTMKSSLLFDDDDDGGLGASLFGSAPAVKREEKLPAAATPAPAPAKPASDLFSSAAPAAAATTATKPKPSGASLFGDDEPMPFLGGAKASGSAATSLFNSGPSSSTASSLFGGAAPAAEPKASSVASRVRRWAVCTDA